MLLREGSLKGIIVRYCATRACQGCRTVEEGFIKGPQPCDRQHKNVVFFHWNHAPENDVLCASLSLEVKLRSTTCAFSLYWNSWVHRSLSDEMWCNVEQEQQSGVEPLAGCRNSNLYRSAESKNSDGRSPAPEHTWRIRKFLNDKQYLSPEDKIRWTK